MVLAGSEEAPVVLTCEHATEHLPAPFHLPDGDHRLRGTHWAYDLGAAELTHALSARLAAPAVLARFSRLLADPNRPETSRTLFRDEADGLPVLLNRDLDARERERRLTTLHRPYHATVDRVVGTARAAVVLSVHSFTPVYEGEARSVEVGVLFDGEARLAGRLLTALARAGFDARPNEPYSGQRGLMYSVDRHARTHGRRAVEIELRQDLAVVPTVRARVVEALSAVLAG